MDATVSRAAPAIAGPRRLSMLDAAQRLLERPWVVRALAPLIGRFNPFLPEYRIDPYPFYARLRREAPVYFSPITRGLVFTRHADVVALLQDPRFSVERQRAKLFQRLKPFRNMSGAFVEAITSNLLMLDAPRHTRLRRLVNKAFTPRMVARLRPRIETLVDELLAACERRGEMDVIRDLAYPLPVIVIAEMLGLPREDRDRLKHWSDDLAALLDPLQASGGLARLERTFGEVAAYFGDVFAARRAAPRDDLISALATVDDGGDTLGDIELVSLAMLVLGAGHETTTNLIGNAVVALLRHPSERRRLQDDASLLPSAVEEFLRWDSPVQLTDRVATEDGEIAGHRVKTGMMVAVILGAANRDPERFADPDRLDVGRIDNAHVSFGHGVHFCLGAALARLETEIAIGALVRRFPDFAGDAHPTCYRRSMVLRGVTSLPLRLR
jgi:pimeloyl-[acyl-carrier protein] synthase